MWICVALMSGEDMLDTEQEGGIVPGGRRDAYTELPGISSNACDDHHRDTLSDSGHIVSFCCNMSHFGAAGLDRCGMLIRRLSVPHDCICGVPKSSLY